MAYAIQARINMITNQLEPAGVTDSVLIDAFKQVARERFVPDDLESVAYLDDDIRLTPERYLLEPRVLGLMLQHAQIKPSDKVLDIACGSGYSTAIIAMLSNHVVAVESVGELSEVARRNLRNLHTDVQLFNASVSAGYSLKAPYDIIFINGAIEDINDELVDQLNEHGKIYAIKTAYRKSSGVFGVGKATCWTLIDGGLHEQILFDASAPLITEFNRKTSFKF